MTDSSKRSPSRRGPAIAAAAAAILTAVAPGWALAQATAPEDPAVASAPTDVESVVVTGRRRNLVGEAISASEGSVGQAEIAQRPLIRSGDLLEFVPGLVATQHSGSGKANQYFLRGFNLDHGTDFATFVGAMPVNMRSHGHGQGWTDLNFLIPETVGELTYRKGPYYAEVGDFGSAGSARFDIAETLPGFAEVTAGSFGYARAVVADSVAAGSGALLYAAEAQTFEGPWTDIDEDVRKLNVLVKYSAPIGGGRGHVTFMGYDNSWNSPDQIPQRAVDAGIIDELGSLDTTVGGETSRYSLSGGWRGPALGGAFSGEAYAIDSSLDLFSNFTYLLDDPVNGDQFEQVDERRLYGFLLSQRWDRGRSRWRVGAEGRYDVIEQVGLFRTRARERLSAVRDDEVREGSLGLFAENEFRFGAKLRSYVGVRHDRFGFDVRSRTIAENSGEAEDSKTSLKASLIYQPVQPVELYASFGQGIHSNDARGTTIRIDPVTGDPAEPLQPLVASRGGELGARVFLSDRLQATAAVWALELDSELVFVGDAGNVEANRGSERRGIEAGLYYFGGERFEADLEVAYTDAQFTDEGPADGGEEIPGSLPLVIGAGFTAKWPSGYLATARLRYFGAGPLIEDDSVRSDGSLQVNLRVGKSWRRVGLFLDVLNALDSDDHDVEYFYASRLAGEPEAGVEDIHFHVFQPRSARVSLRYAF